MTTPWLAKLAAIAPILSLVAAPLLAAAEQSKTYGAGVTIEKPVALLKLPLHVVGTAHGVVARAADRSPARAPRPRLRD